LPWVEWQPVRTRAPRMRRNELDRRALNIGWPPLQRGKAGRRPFAISLILFEIDRSETAGRVAWLARCWWADAGWKREPRWGSEEKWLEVVAGLGGFEVLDAVAEQALLGEYFDEDDLAGDEDGGLAFLVRDGDFDEGLGVILFGAFEAQAAFGHVLAGDDVFAAIGITDAGGVADFDARVFAAIDAREGGVFRSGRSHGEDGGARLPAVVRRNRSGLRANTGSG
jgi:hypothetical protein